MRTKINQDEPTFQALHSRVALYCPEGTFELWYSVNGEDWTDTGEEITGPDSVNISGFPAYAFFKLTTSASEWEADILC